MIDNAARFEAMAKAMAEIPDTENEPAWDYETYPHGWWRLSQDHERMPITEHD